MSGETEKEVSGWTVDTLRELIITRMDERDRRYTEKFDAQEKAVLVALDQTRTRFENVNEWRGTVSDLLANAMPRPEAVTINAATNDKIQAINSRLDKIEGGGSSKHALFGYVVAVAGILIAIGALVLRSQGA